MYKFPCKTGRSLSLKIRIDYNSVQFVLKKIIKWYNYLITKASSHIYLSSSALTFRGVCLLPGCVPDHTA